MRLHTKVNPFIFKYTLFRALFLSVGLYCQTFAGDTTIGDLNARIDDLERQINEGGGRTDDANPGAHVVTPEDLERLKEEMRAIRDNRQGSEDMNRLRDEINLMRDDMKQLQKENAELRKQKFSKKEDSSLDSAEDKPLVNKKVTPASDNVEEKSFIKQKDNSWKQTQSSSFQAPPDDLDDETESVLKMLEKSAPGEEGQEEADSTPTKGQKKNTDTEADRTTATKRAEDSSPQAMYLKGVSFFQRKKYKDAKIAFVKAYKMNPKGPNAADCLLKLGEVLAQDNKSDACTAWRKLETDFPRMSPEMKSELTTLKKANGCVKKTENASKPVPNR